MSLVPVTAAVLRPICSFQFEYTQDLIEYPKTHELGYTYVIQTGNLNAEEVKMLASDVSTLKVLYNYLRTDFSRFNTEKHKFILRKQFTVPSFELQ
jgi:hypothetical protein